MKAALEVRFRRRPRLRWPRPGAWQLLGRAQEADADFRKALELQPDKAHLHSDWLLSLHYWRGAEPLLEEHLAWRSVIRAASDARRARGARARPKRRMNIGYFSPEFQAALGRELHRAPACSARQEPLQDLLLREMSRFPIPSRSAC